MSPERWPPGPETPRLADDEVHLWRADLAPDPARIPALAATLDRDEQTRAARLRVAAARSRFVVGRAFLRDVLARYLAIPPAAVTLAYGPKGKPALASPEAPLRFNLSHSHDVAVCAVAARRELGVDVERVREVAADRIAARYFSPRERALVGALEGAAAGRAFFRLWTCKEAYLKAVGTGVSRPLAEVEIGPDDGPEPRLAIRDQPEESDRWSLRALALDAEHAAALAVEGRGWTLTCWRWRAR
jgi:4'-phosphopantetheinyl transferase